MKRSLVAPLSALVLLVGLAFTSASAPAEAASVDGFNPGNIISDGLFYDGRALDPNEVQAFLNQRVSRCTIGDPGRQPGAVYGNNRVADKCLRNFSMSTQSKSANAYCAAYVGGANESAAAIISKVGQACGISQKVLLVMLEKEQSLISDSWPFQRQLDVAMGYDCPDSGPNYGANCNPAQIGFFNQVYKSAWQLKVYKVQPSSYNYQPFRNNTILWHPNRDCGTSQVYIENWATAALYIYTPYRPNTAALNAGWGTGDGCSTYGNRNFYLFYTNWFGSTQGFSVSGAALETWKRFGGVDGTLGAPTGNAKYYSANGGGYVQTFSRGAIFTESRTGKSTAMTNGPFQQNYKDAGYVGGSWGWPTGDATCKLVAAGCMMPFQTGIVAYSSSTGSHLVPTEMLPEWTRLSTVNGLLGYPVSEPVRSSIGVGQEFQGGISMVTTAGAFTFNPEASAAWKSPGGGISGLGLVTAPVVRVDSARYFINFERGDLYVTIGQNAVKFGKGTFLTEYRAEGGPSGPWGWPLAAGVCDSAGACTMNFETGQAVFSKATGVSFLQTSYVDLWNANGGQQGSLKYPIGKPQEFTDGSMQAFQGGNLVVGPTASVRFGGGAFLKTYTAAGGPESSWGWPTAPGICNVLATCTMNFSEGQAVYTKATGVSFISTAFKDLWTLNGGYSGSLRYPIGETQRFEDGAMHTFQGGNLIVGPATNVRFSGGAFLRAYLSEGGPSGSWGWPLQPGVCAPSGDCTMPFSEGQATYTKSDGVKFILALSGDGQ